LQVEEKKAWSDETWQSYKLEILYHRLCSSPQKNLPPALNEFLAAWKNQRSFAQRWGETIMQAGKDVDAAAVRRWGGQLVEGLKAYDEKRYSSAVPMLTDLLSYGDLKEKWRSIALNRRGYVYLQLSEYYKALEDFTEAIKLTPDDAEYFKDRGFNYIQMVRYLEALQDLDRAIEIDPKYTIALAIRGETYLLMARYSEALQDLDRAIEIDPKNWGNTFNLALYSLAAGNIQQAQKLYQYALTRGASLELILVAHRDLKDFLTIFPNHVQAQEMRKLLHQNS
jgi:tetratricopeptide (TPR) repeat protein